MIHQPHTGRYNGVAFSAHPKATARCYNICSGRSIQFCKKVRKQIDQIPHRGPVREDIPSPGKGGLERVEEIIRDRVAKGAGRPTTFADEPAVAFEDGAVTYIIRQDGTFWTVVSNR